MRALVEQIHLAPALELARRATDPKSAADAFRSITLRASSSEVSVYATDSIVSVSAHIPATVEKPGVLMVSAKSLAAVVGKLSGEVRIEEVGPKAHARAGKLKYQIERYESDLAPDPVSPPEYQVEMPAQVLRRLLSIADTARSADTTRPQIGGVLLQIGAGKIRAVATNGAWMIVLEEATAAEGSLDVLLPGRLLPILLRALDTEGIVRLGTDSKRIYAQAGGVVLSCRLGESAFPQYQQVIPSEWKTTLKVSAADLVSAISSVIVVDDSTGGIVLRHAESALTVVCDAIDRAAETTVDLIEWHGQTARVGFSARYLTDALKAFGGEVEVCANGELDPWLIKGAHGHAAVMPMRI
jgi:DNA polymerase-3 subunit beta